MGRTIVPGPLRERLGEDGTLALVEMFQSAEQEWSDGVLTRSDERFGRVLADEFGKLRLEMHQGDAALRRDFDVFRTEMHQEFAAVRKEMNDGFAAVRQEMSQCEIRLAREIAAMRFDVLKWSFLFWVGQLAATLGLLAFMLGRAPR